MAGIHAITVERAMGMCVNNLVTQEYLDATLDARFAEQGLTIEKRFAEQDAKFEQRFNKADRDMLVLKLGQVLVVGTVLVPQIAKLLG